MERPRRETSKGVAKLLAGLNDDSDDDKPMDEGDGGEFTGEFDDDDDDDSMSDDDDDDDGGAGVPGLPCGMCRDGCGNGSRCAKRAVYRKYDRGANGKARRAKYDRGAKGKARRAKYNKSAPGIARTVRWNASAGAAKARAKYVVSVKGLAKRLQYRITRSFWEKCGRVLVRVFMPKAVQKRKERRGIGCWDNAALACFQRIKEAKAAKRAEWSAAYELGAATVEAVIRGQPGLKRVLRTSAPLNFDGARAKHFLESVDVGGSVYHATDVGPDELEPYDGASDVLRPFDCKDRGLAYREAVWGTGGHAALALGFVQGHMGKKRITNARDNGDGLFLYIMSPGHPDYDAFQQHFINGGQIPWGSVGLFTKCRTVVRVAQGTPGLTVVRFDWPNGPAADPVAVVVRGDARGAALFQPPFPTPLPPRRVCAASDGLVCEVCGSGDCATTLLHCDGCEVGAAHADCAFLSDSDVPGGAWFCPACGGPPYVDLACQRKPKKKKRRVALK